MWNYASIVELGEYGYAVGQRDTHELSPMAATSLKEPTLPLRPCWVTSGLVGKAHVSGCCVIAHYSHSPSVPGWPAQWLGLWWGYWPFRWPCYGCCHFHGVGYPQLDQKAISKCIQALTSLELARHSCLNESLMIEVWQFPATMLFQGPEQCSSLLQVEVKKLTPLSKHLAAWKLLPNLSQWVLHTIKKGYRIQLGFWPPWFNGVHTVPLLWSGIKLYS